MYQRPCIMKWILDGILSSIGTCPVVALARTDLPIDDKITLPLCALSASVVNLVWFSAGNDFRDHEPVLFAGWYRQSKSLRFS
jgi:hypothetical protein